MAASLLILTGASGVGKTTIALEIEEKHPEITVCRFDTIGVPTPEVMAGYGTGHQPGGAWQRAMTLQWIERIAAILDEGRSVLFEGQMRIAFIQEALECQHISGAHIILLECEDHVRNARLASERQQPELANESMSRWSRYLREEALQTHCEILNTGALPLAETVSSIAARLKESSKA